MERPLDPPEPTPVPGFARAEAVVNIQSIVYLHHGTQEEIEAVEARMCKEIEDALHEFILSHFVKFDSVTVEVTETQVPHA